MIIAIIIIAVCVIIYFVVKGNNSSKTKTVQTPLSHSDMMGIARSIGKNEHGNYWQSFKLRKPQEAKAIEQLCGRNMDSLSNADAFQIVSTFLRWSDNTGKPISSLKDDFIEEMNSLISDGATFEMLLPRFKAEKAKEAIHFNIAEDFTICNYMYEWLVEMKNKQKADSITERIVQSLNIPQEEMDSFIKEIENKKEELNLAPDISKLDREENKLFNLANEGVQMFDDFYTLNGLEQIPHKLNEKGKIEARILCSTMVMDLHSNFKNEIDLDNQTDRYFLLLADSSFSGPDDVIGFINSRIAFYKKEREEWASINALEVFKPHNVVARIYNLLYIDPLSEHPEEIESSDITANDLVMFKHHFEKVQKAMILGRNRIVGNVSNDAEVLRSIALDTFNGMTTREMRNNMNKDIAWLLTDQVITMVKQGQIDDGLSKVFPESIKSQIMKLISNYKQTTLSEEDANDILEDAQNEFLKGFVQ